MSKIIEVKNLKTYFPVAGGVLHAIDDVSLSIKKGHTLGVVGESGCGKTTLGRTILHLEKSTSGEIYFDNKNITNPRMWERKELRKKMQIIYQDPSSSLNPRLSIEQVIREPLLLSKRFKNNDDLEEELDRLLDLVGIDKRLRTAYSHELDGGRRQRVVIGRALAMNPEFIVCDEPVSALDVSIQAQILNLLTELQEKIGLTYMFITHDLSVVRYVSDEICVMYLGQIVEKGNSDVFFNNPTHPYSQALLSAVPTIDIHDDKKRIVLKGELASPINPKEGCRFAPRCQYACEKCNCNVEMCEVEKEHYVLCNRARELFSK